MRPKNTTRLLVAAGAVATLSLGVAFLVGEGNSELLPKSLFSDSSSERPSEESDDKGGKGPRAKLPDGRLVMLGSYDFDYSTKVVSAGQPMLQVNLEGAVRIAPVTGKDSVYRLDFEGTPNASVGQNPLPGFVGEMGRPVFLEVMDEGRYQTKGETQLSEVARKTWMMIGDFVLARPGSEQSRESSALGRCEVKYSAPRAGQVVREKVWCGSEVGTKVDAIKDLSSKQTFEVDAKGLVSGSSLTESLRTEGKNIPELGVETRISATRTNANVVAVSAVTYDAASVLKRDEEAIRREMDVQRIGGRTYKGVLAEFLKIAVKGAEYKPTEQEEAAMSRDFVALTALLRTDPEAAQMAVDHVRNNGPLTELLMDALRDAGTPDAQRALLDVAEDGGRDSKQRYMATRNLSALNQPTPETVDFLLKSKQDPIIGEQVTYSTGAVAGNVRGSNPAVADQLVNSLVEQLREAPGPLEVEATLKSLGNAGGAEVLPEVKDALNSESARTRAAAVNAVRRVESKDADAAILAALSDPNQLVRYAAAKALGDRPISAEAVETIARMMLVEKDFRVLSQEIYVAGRWLGEGQETLRAPLAQLASTATDESVRERAKRLLERHPA